MHVRETLHECTVCRKRFAEKGPLFVDRLLHDGTQATRCAECSRGLSRRGYYAGCVRIRAGATGLGNTECSVSKPDAPKLHLLIYCQEKPSSCEECSQRSGSRANERTGGQGVKAGTSSRALRNLQPLRLNQRSGGMSFDRTP